MGPQAPRTRVLGSARIAAFEDNGIVLVHRQQAFAATGRAENQHRIAAWRLAIAGSRMLARQSRRPCGSARRVRGRSLARHRCRIVLCQQRFRDLRQLRPGHPQRMRIRPPRRSRRRAERLPRAQPKQVARGQCADHAPDSSTTPRWRIRAGPCGRWRDRRRRPPERGKRAAHELLDRQIERARAGPRDRPQHVALGHDAGVGCLEPPEAAGGADIDGRYSLAASVALARRTERAGSTKTGGVRMTSRMRWR